MTFGSVINTAQPAMPMNAASSAYSTRSWALSSLTKCAANRACLRRRHHERAAPWNPCVLASRAQEAAPAAVVVVCVPL